MNKLQKAALSVFAGCILVMAAVVLYGMVQDNQENEEDFLFE